MTERKIIGKKTTESRLDRRDLLTHSSLATPNINQEELADASRQDGTQTQPVPPVDRTGRPEEEPQSCTQFLAWSGELAGSKIDGDILRSFPTPEEDHSPEDLDLLRLNAPITAVHSMRPNCPSTDSSSPQSHRLHASARGVESPLCPLRESNPDTSGFDDVISAGLLSESKARELFHLYMAGANIFLPLFDSSTDTFEAIRERSAFCLCAILTVALQLDRSLPDSEDVLRKCTIETQALASRTLFSSSPKPEDIQGMLVLAAYAEKNWFAVSHALEMAEDIGLRNCLPRLLGEREHGHGIRPTPSSQKRLTRMARVFLVLHNVEREVASGIARKSKLEPLNEQHLRSFLECKYAVIYDIRIVSTIEITQLRGANSAHVPLL